MNNPDTPQQNDLDRHALISRVAGRVREVRKQKGMPRRVVSELSGVSPRYLAQLEAGEGNISIALLERVARALEMPIEALIAQQISVDPEARRIAQLFERAPDNVRESVKALLNAHKPVGPRPGRICLMGLRGAGKTTLGRRAAEALRIPFIELSSMIEDETGMPLSEVLSLYGANGYRRLEADALEKVIKMSGPLILSVSGGLVEQETPYTRLLAQFHTIWLRTSPAEHVARVRAQGAMQPVRDETQALAQITSLMNTREPLYARAQAQLDTGARPAQQSVRDLVALIAEKQFLPI
ncbi:helix-turn-helix transcriptional regulator [uncultured Sulfitobacter sp.]|uniref:helix-turn-helix transcriptional regulator n=1 Tax=uncultured Sulfitobacter sp. TaxID=191468 RepID=UPI00260FC976|nr:helix-turn-helix transcriptional regulator [uncultured Sulfitobacter sp.]